LGVGEALLQLLVARRQTNELFGQPRHLLLGRRFDLGQLLLKRRLLAAEAGTSFRRAARMRSAWI
jgi:hypothetical protein